MSIILDHVNYVYGADTPLAVHALNDVCLKIPDGQFIGIIGHTGSGKSTLMQHMNGLIRATDGHIYFNGEDIYDKDYDMKKLRSKVGWCSSIRSISCLRSMYSAMFVSDRRIWDWIKKKWSFVHTML